MRCARTAKPYFLFAGLLPLCLAVNMATPVGAEECSLIINEIQLESLLVKVEFIELKKNCSGPLDLTPYTMILWHGTAGSKGVNKLDHKAAFNTVNVTSAACRTMNSSLLVLGGDGVKVLLDNSTQFCHFDSFGDEWKAEVNKPTIDKTAKTTNALTLYKGLEPVVVEKLTLNTSLTDDTANRNSMVDIVFFSGNKGGGGETIKSLLFPEYTVGPSDKNIYYRIADIDKGNVTAEDRRSFSYCCSQSSVGGKWPMAFKYTKPSPGVENNCSDPAEYAFDPKGTTFNLNTDRCDVRAMENYFPKPSPTSTPVPIPTTTGQVLTPEETERRVRVMGLSVGIPLALVILFLGGYILFMHQRQRYNGVPESELGRTCMRLSCLQSGEEGSRLVMNT